MSHEFRQQWKTQVWLGQECEKYEAEFLPLVKGKLIYGRLARNANFSADENMNENWNIETQ